MNTWFELLGAFVNWLAHNSLQACLLVGLILALQFALRDRIAPRWRYALWLILVVKLALPWSPPSAMSLYNLLSYAYQPVAAALDGNAADGGTSVVPQNADADPPPAPQPGATPAPLAGVLPSATTPTGATPGATPAPFAGVLPSAAQTTGDSPPAASALAHLLPILPLIWLAGACLLALLTAIQALRMGSVRQERFVTDQATLELLEDCKQQMEVPAYLAVVETSRVAGPALFGFLRPRLLLPTGAIASLGPARLRHVFLHELAHLKRYDITVNWLLAILQILHWFNPLIWYAFARMRNERELACDALALSRPGAPEPSAYGRTIVDMLDTFVQPRRQPSLAGVLEDKSQLKRRISMIAQFRKSRRSWPIPAVALLVLVGVVALTSAQTRQPATAPASSPALVQVARQVVADMAKGDFPGVTRHFDDTMKAALSPANLQAAWEAVTREAGPFQEQLGVRAEQFGPYRFIFVTCRFQQGPIDAKVVFDKSGQVTGLFLQPAPMKTDAAPASPTTDNSKLNEAQRLYDQWTDRTFPEVTGSKQFEGLSQVAAAEMETRWLAALRGPKNSAYQQAICNLGAIKSRKAVPLLVQIAAQRVEKDNADRCMAVRSLGLIGDASVVPQLIPLLYHYNQNTRFSAQISLVQLTGQNFGDDWQKWAEWWNSQGKAPKVASEPVAWPCSDPQGMDRTKQKASDVQCIEGLKRDPAGTEGAQVPDNGTAAAAAKGAAPGPAPAAANDAVRKALRTKFELRMRQDLQKYNREQISEAEQLYQVANKSWQSPEAKTSLEQMIAKYPDLNRTGCAVLYMAQMAKGDEQKELLKQTIEKHGNCMYGDGVQVGAYARFYLAEIYDEAGDKAKAKTLYDEIRKQFPLAVNHRGVPLAQLIEASHPTSQPPVTPD